VKPWDDETDMKKLEAAVRAVKKDGLVWGGCKYPEAFYFNLRGHMYALSFT
jgi:translation elongation factor EF-1beta